MAIAKLEHWVFRAPVAAPVANAFGSMSNRPALFVRISASDGAWGWGEVFCNFPQVGAEHRARLIASIFTPLLEGCARDDPATVRTMLEARTRRMAIQCGEPGPFAQITGAIDQALWDLAARRAGLPLWKYLGTHAGVADSASNRVQVYASGIGPERVVDVALAKRAEGYRAFKLKVGFGTRRDVENLSAMRAALGADAAIMVDANQVWEPADAVARIAELMPFNPYWVEEPIAADEPTDAWRTLSTRSAAPLAAGENLRGDIAFDTALEAGFLHYVQPDVGKWGGISGCLAVAQRAQSRGVVFCPHWLAGGLGLAASLHLRAALGPQGFAEVDANPNPLREEVFPLVPREGWVTLSDAPGMGIAPDLARLSGYAVATH